MNTGRWEFRSSKRKASQIACLLAFATASKKLLRECKKGAAHVRMSTIAGTTEQRAILFKPRL